MSITNHIELYVYGCGIKLLAEIVQHLSKRLPEYNIIAFRAVFELIGGLAISFQHFIFRINFLKVENVKAYYLSNRASKITQNIAKLGDGRG
jgi:hypothetical protein